MYSVLYIEYNVNMYSLQFTGHGYTQILKLLKDDQNRNLDVDFTF